MSKTAFRVATVLFFAVVLLLLVNTNMRKGLSHDEHMYVAGGALLARDGLLPYRDYPYLQMPNLALVYGALFLVTDDLLLAARLLNTLFAVVMLCAIFYFTTSLLPAAGNMARWLVGAGCVLLIVANPIFIYTSGLAWNHDLPVLLALLAVILYFRGVGGQRGGRWLLCGLLLGLAAGTRLTFVFAFIPFGAGILLLAETTGRRKLHLLARILTGALLGLLPTIFLAALAPTRFVFGNWDYHQANEAYWQQSGYDRAMDIPGKLAYLKDVAVEPGNLVLLAAFVLLVLMVGGRAFRRRQLSFSPQAFVVVLIVVLLIGTLVPTPSWYQYYHVLVPFVVLGIVYAVSSLYKDERWRRASLLLFAVAVVATGVYALPAYVRLGGDLSADGWVPLQAHRVGVEIKQAVGEGKVATLSPLFPLEGGARIYRELATGPFEWRVSGLLTGAQRAELNVLSADNLEAFFAKDPPQGILVGFEGALEEPFVQYAMKQGYSPMTLSNGATLWLQGVVIVGKEVENRRKGSPPE